MLLRTSITTVTNTPGTASAIDFAMFEKLAARFLSSASGERSDSKPCDGISAKLMATFHNTVVIVMYR